MHLEGIIKWAEVFAALKVKNYHGVFLFEDGRGGGLKEWIRLATAFPENFAARNGR